MSEQVKTTADEAPMTKERKVPLDPEEHLGNAGLPRACIAASREHPQGSSGRKSNKSAKTHDLGFNIFFSIFVATVIHGSFSYVTQKSWIPFLGNPFFNIYIEGIHNAKHGSDSETYDTEGRFVPEKFEEIFSKYDRNNKDGLNFTDIIHMMHVNANLFDLFGWFATALEWGTLYMLCVDNKGIINKEDVRACYDGSLFYRMSSLNQQNKVGGWLKPGITSLKSQTEE
ncbi:9694_t:CDS:2 [Funneliformis geosporum]|uniref:117_t:CDS:1 n=1 Tax=Funneliformis geosporum TaxID=1117311 RepID=A0A9W4WKI2_9GLOM|nr:9694_t:CDS:2 [Funneliformis geosporum]CAI2168777.1 117_t:CDS:2 [Funneliformis geosporum]